MFNKYLNIFNWGEINQIVNMFAHNYVKLQSVSRHLAVMNELNWKLNL